MELSLTLPLSNLCSHLLSSKHQNDSRNKCLFSESIKPGLVNEITLMHTSTLSVDIFIENYGLFFVEFYNCNEKTHTTFTQSIRL